MDVEGVAGELLGPVHLAADARDDLRELFTGLRRIHHLGAALVALENGLQRDVVESVVIRALGRLRDLGDVVVQAHAVAGILEALDSLGYLGESDERTDINGILEQLDSALGVER